MSKQTPKTKTEASGQPALCSKDLLARIELEIKRLDPKLDKDDESYKAAVVLLASANIGTNQEKIHKLTNYPRTLIAKFAHYLKKSGVWRGRKVYADWFEKDGGIALWCDVAVCRGLLQRTPAR